MPWYQWGLYWERCQLWQRNNPELPTKVQDIANGSDELYGEGVPIEHGTNPDERFSSGGVDHTHQYIVANALKILSNDKGNSAFNGELNSSILMEATDWPDKLGKKQMQELLQDTFMILILEKTGLVKNLRQLGQEQSHIFRQQ